jgi:hypothetical protein
MANMSNDILTLARINPSRSDTWFAWYPVRVGALGTGRFVWLRRVWRNKCCGVTIYQPLDLIRNPQKTALPPTSRAESSGDKSPTRLPGS